jgi:hypothetical protein
VAGEPTEGGAPVAVVPVVGLVLELDVVLEEDVVGELELVLVGLDEEEGVSLDDDVEEVEDATLADAVTVEVTVN